MGKTPNHSSNGDELDLTTLPALPHGWCWVMLSAIAIIDGGITKNQKRRRTSTMREVPYLRVANVQRSYLDLQEMKTILAEEEEIVAMRLLKGDVLFTEGGDRDKLGRGWVWNDEIAECIHQNHIFRARLCLPLVEPKFVSFHGNFFGQQWFTTTGKQTTNLASINKGVLNRFPVPLAPLIEQRRIVGKIEELFSDLDAGVAALERIKANLKRYRAAVLKAAVEGRLTEAWRAKHPKTEPAAKLLERILAERRKKWEEDQLAKFAAADRTPPKGWREKYVEPGGPETNQLPEIPQGWCWATVEQLAEVQGGIQKQPKRMPGKNAFPFLRVANVLRDLLDLSEVHRIELFGHELGKLRLVQGDLLIVEGNGSKMEIGRSAIWRGEIENCVHQNHIIRVRVSVGSPRYVNYYWNSPSGNQRVMSQAASTSGLYTLSVGKVSSLPIPVPPSDEQEQITAEVEQRLSIIVAAAAQADANLKRSTRLRQCILKRAFEGKLVPQDPTDEPAAKLVERIRLERSEMENGRQAKRRREMANE
jgi:type I restriction enzyme, S subunit